MIILLFFFQSSGLDMVDSFLGYYLKAVHGEAVQRRIARRFRPRNSENELGQCSPSVEVVGRSGSLDVSLHGPST
jgi:hypothetical protein